MFFCSLLHFPHSTYSRNQISIGKTHHSTFFRPSFFCNFPFLSSSCWAFCPSKGKQALSSYQFFMQLPFCPQSRKHKKHKHMRRFRCRSRSVRFVTSSKLLIFQKRAHHCIFLELEEMKYYKTFGKSYGFTYF